MQEGTAPQSTEDCLTVTLTSDVGIRAERSAAECGQIRSGRHWDSKTTALSTHVKSVNVAGIDLPVTDEIKVLAVDRAGSVTATHLQQTRVSRGTHDHATTTHSNLSHSPPVDKRSGFDARMQSDPL